MVRQSEHQDLKEKKKKLQCKCTVPFSTQPITAECNEEVTLSKNATSFCELNVGYCFA